MNPAAAKINGGMQSCIRACLRPTSDAISCFENNNFESGVGQRPSGDGARPSGADDDTVVDVSHRKERRTGGVEEESLVQVEVKRKSRRRMLRPVAAELASAAAAHASLSSVSHVDSRLCSFTRSPACISTDERACARLYHMPRHRQRGLGSYRLLRAQHVESTLTGFGARQKDHGGRRFMYADCYPKHLPLTDSRRLSRRKLGAVDGLSRRRVCEHRTADTSCLTDVSFPLCVP
jgi:hypothetical protein